MATGVESPPEAEPAPEHAVLWRRLACLLAALVARPAGDVQPRTGKSAFLQRGNQRSLVDHAAAAEIDDDGAFLHAADGAIRPPLHGGRRDHAFQEAVELVVGLDHIAIPPAVRC